MNAIVKPKPQAGSRVLELTILMPCLNEAETIGTCVAKAQAFLSRAGIAGEVLIADNGSSDGSQAIAAELGARVVPVTEKGYGAALLGGIDAAHGRYIIMGDADDSYDFTSLDAFVDRLRAGADVVMGNRFKGGIGEGAMPVLHRYLGNPVLSFLGRLFFRIPTGDFHCGLRGFNADRIRALKLNTTGMEFASEMVVRSGLAGYRIEEVPTTLKKDGRSRPPHLKTWRDGWRHLKFLLTYNPRWLFFIPGTALAAVGALIMAALMFGPIEIAQGLHLDVNSFIAGCFMVVGGVQLITFGVLSRYYAHLTGILPGNRRSDWLIANLSTDRIALNAFILLLGGFAMFGIALWQWAAVGFGDLTSPAVSRLVLFGLTLVVISLQAFFSAFLLGVLEIPVKSAGSCPIPDMAVLRAIADRQELRFLVVGGGVSLAFLLMSWGFAAAGAPPFAGTVTAYAIAFLGAYLLQRNWTFRAAVSHSRSFPRYLAAQIVCAGLAGCVAHVATALFAAPPFWMAVAGTGTAAATSYVLTSLWVFPKASRPD